MEGQLGQRQRERKREFLLAINTCCSFHAVCSAQLYEPGIIIKHFHISAPLQNIAIIVYDLFVLANIGLLVHLMRTRFRTSSRQLRDLGRWLIYSLDFNIYIVLIWLGLREHFDLTFKWLFGYSGILIYLFFLLFIQIPCAVYLLLCHRAWNHLSVLICSIGIAGLALNIKLLNYLMVIQQ